MSSEMRRKIMVAACAFAAAVALAAGAKTVDAKGVVVNGKTVCKTERRDFADGMAVRYVLPEGERRVEREETVWTLPADAKVWYQEYGMDYEKPYCSSLVRDIPAGTVMNFPVTAKLADGTYRLITEANVVGYTDSAAKYLGDGRFGVFYVNDPDGFDQKGADTTPWRVMLVAKDLQTLATSDIVRRLCPAPSAEVAAKAAKFVRPGRAVWQWLPAGAPKYGEQKEWYDRTKALGFEYYLIDDGWRDWRDGDMDQWACLKKWIDYGKSIGVETFMWVDSKEMRNAETRRRYLAKVKAAGAVGIKIDFHPAPSCEQMAWYEEALADTLEFGLMTDYHGCVKPSGREKTWPHEVAREAIRGHEWHITRYKRVLPPEHDCILPFNRLVQGHADYTPVVFEEKELAGYTRARELAQGIIFSAPFLCLGDYPQNYLESPAAEVVKALKPIYDETIILPGSEIGECVAVAKRRGGKWFIAIENGAEARKLRIDFCFLGEGEYDMTAFADDTERPDGYAISRRLVGRDGSLDLEIKPKGGFVAWLRSKTGRASVGAPETRAQGLCRCQVHRGGGRDTRPDNSLETFLWCWGHGVAPEADARLTKDGVAIAFHDPTLQRIARGISGELQSREIKDMTWEEIKDVDVGSYMGEEYATTRIATMDSIFAAMAGRPDRILYLDEKGAPPEMMAQMARKHGVEKQIYYTSPDFRLMARWQEVVPDGLGMVWLGTWPTDNSAESVARADEFLERTFREMEDANWKGISQIQLHIRTDLTKPDPFCPSTECLKKSIELLHAKGITVQAFTWTEGANKDVLRRIWSLGFDNFATDDPLVLFELLPEFAGCGK